MFVIYRAVGSFSHDNHNRPLNIREWTYRETTLAVNDERRFVVNDEQSAKSVCDFLNSKRVII